MSPFFAALAAGLGALQLAFVGVFLVCLQLAKTRPVFGVHGLAGPLALICGVGVSVPAALGTFLFLDTKRQRRT